MSLKDFAIVAKLGEGAYSSVYKVQRHVDGQIYALKKVKMNNLSEKEQENALNQVRILASVKSPYVIGYKHAFIQTNSLCIVMQFSDDSDLYQKIVQHIKSNTQFEQQYIWRVLIQVVMGLKSLHELNILHRDLKSANVFLSKDGTAKLGDMNVSKIAKNGLLYTQTGTPYYASPQVWKDKPYDSKSDIWSLGCVIYQMATLRPPFRAQDMDGLFRKVIKGAYQKISDHYSKALSSVIKSMLQVNPANRPSANQLLINLQSKAEQFHIEIPADIPQLHKQLLQTIRVNKNLHYLTDRLPKSNYANGYQHQKVQKLNQSTKVRPTRQRDPTLAAIGIHQLHSYPNKNINLPKLDKIINKNNNNNNYKSPVQLYQERQQRNQHRKAVNIDVSNLLKIEGRSNQRNQYHRYEQPKRVIDNRDIKAQLKKIYNFKPSPSKLDRPIKPIYRNVQLPRIN